MSYWACDCWNTVCRIKRQSLDKHKSSAFHLRSQIQSRFQCVHCSVYTIYNLAKDILNGITYSTSSIFLEKWNSIIYYLLYKIIVIIKELDFDTISLCSMGLGPLEWDIGIYESFSYLQNLMSSQSSTHKYL